MKYIVTMEVETKVAMIIEADSEEAAAQEAERLAKEDKGEFLNEFMDPREFIEFPLMAVAGEIHDAAQMGYADRRAANQSK